MPSDLTDFAKDKLKINGTVLEVLKVGETLFKTMSGVVSAIDTAKTILSKLGIFDGNDELTVISQNVNTLLRDFQVLFAEQTAEDRIRRMVDVAKILEDARQQLSVVRRNSPLTDAQKAIMDNDSGAAVRTLGNLAFYLRPSFPELVYRDAWAGILTPPVPAGFQAFDNVAFDYRLTLPAYIELILIRQIVTVAVVEDFRRVLALDAVEILKQLESLYTTIRDGIVSHVPPTFIQMEIMASYLGDVMQPPSFYDYSLWDQGGRLYGAVERYSAASVVDAYPAGRNPNFYEYFLIQDDTIYVWIKEYKSAATENYKRFLAGHAIGTLARRKELYATVGLPTIWAILNQLRILAGNASAVQITDPDQVWSLREVDNAVATAMLNQSSTASPNGSISIKNLLGMLGATAPMTVREVLADVASRGVRLVEMVIPEVRG